MPEIPEGIYPIIYKVNTGTMPATVKLDERLSNAQWIEILKEITTSLEQVELTEAINRS